MTDYTNWEEALTNRLSPTWDSTLCHHGTKGQEWGRRRFQYEDGSLTPAGRERYGVGEKRESGGLKRLFKSKKKRISQMTDEELKAAIERRNLEKQYKESNPNKGLIEKGVSLIKDISEARAAHKQAEAEAKYKQRELDYKERELKVRGKEAETNAAKAEADKTRAEADKTRAEAEKTKNEADRLRANAEYDKTQYYTSTWRGKWQHGKELKTERLKAKNETKKLKNEKKRLGKRYQQHELDLAKEKTKQSHDTVDVERAKENAAFYISQKAANETVDSISKMKNESLAKDFMDKFMSRYYR